MDHVGALHELVHDARALRPLEVDRDPPLALTAAELGTAVHAGKPGA
jgi:hypothetical protein